MAESETNAHLHKVLTHRNYMHHITLQKELKNYDKQKKVVEKELSQITKVRRAIQQINGTFPKEPTKEWKRVWEQEMAQGGCSFGKEEAIKEHITKESILKKSNVSSQGLNKLIITPHQAILYIWDFIQGIILGR